MKIGIRALLIDTLLVALAGSGAFIYALYLWLPSAGSGGVSIFPVLFGFPFIVLYSLCLVWVSHRLGAPSPQIRAALLVTYGAAFGFLGPFVANYVFQLYTLVAPFVFAGTGSGLVAAVRSHARAPAG